MKRPPKPGSARVRAPTSGACSGRLRDMGSGPVVGPVSLHAATAARMASPVMRTATWCNRIHPPKKGSTFCGQRHLEALRLQTGRETSLFDRAHVRFVGLDHLLFDELEERVVQRQHPQLLAGLNDRGDLERLALTDQVRDGRCGSRVSPSGTATTPVLLDHLLEITALSQSGYITRI